MRYAMEQCICPLGAKMPDCRAIYHINDVDVPLLTQDDRPADEPVIVGAN